MKTELRRYINIFAFMILPLQLFCDISAFDTVSVYDWKSGHINSKIVLDLNKSKTPLPSGRNAAFNLIERYMPPLLKDMYLSVIVDSSHRVGNYLAEGSIHLSDLNRIIENGIKADQSFTLNLDKAVVYHTTPTHDFAKLFIKHKKPYIPFLPPDSSISRVYTGILIDARGKLPVHGEYIEERVAPCIFPKIWDADMSLIYEKNMVDPKVAVEKSIVVYSDTLNEESYKDVIGSMPLRIIARGVYGENRTDPIISAVDSAKILSRPENLNLLYNGRVVILCDNESLVVKNTQPQPDDGFYFMYNDIETLLKKAKPKNIGVSNSKNIIKITMYDIRFVADKPDILPEEQGRIDIIAEALSKAGGNTRFLIEGHTADLKLPEAELVLSVQRAQKMADELAKRGIDPKRIDTAGFGSTRPIAPSDTNENRAKNRRVEITIIRD